MSWNNKWSRRSILTGLGLSALAPFVPLTSAEADDELLPQRLLLVFFPFGKTPDFADLSGGPSSLNLGGMYAPLDVHSDVLTVVDNLDKVRDGDFPGDPHQEGTTQCWTNGVLQDGGEFGVGGQNGSVGWGTGPDGSIDQYLASRLDPGTLLSTLTLGVQCRGANPNSRTIYTGPGAPVAPRENPADVFHLLFDQFDPNADAEQIAQLVQQRKDVLGVVNRQLSDVRQRLPSGVDRERMDAHLTHVETLRQQLDGLADLGACERPDEPLIDPFNDANLPEVTSLMGDMVTSAFACDLTRFASIQLRSEGSAGTANWLGNGDALHSMSHNSSFSSQWRAVYTSLMEQVAGLVTKLRDTREGDGGSLLDNTLVVVGSGIAHSDGHPSRGNAALMFGGGLEGNRYFDTAGADWGKLLVSILHHFGVEDRPTFGNIPTDPGPIAGLV
ncbi:MAG: DUF1552 domain-containing protein [Myxococcota bacterium]